MRRWSGERGQVEPLAALVAVAAVGVGLTLYAGVLDGALPDRSERSLAPAAMERVGERVAPTGVVVPDRVERSHTAGPTGQHTQVVVTADGQRWTSGPDPPSTGDRASQRVGVRVGPARVVPGRLRVVVW